MAAKLSKRDIARLGVKIPEGTTLTANYLNSDTLKSLKNKGRQRGKPRSKGKVDFSGHVALEEQRVVESATVESDPVEYPEWVIVELNNVHAVPKERQRFGKGFVFTSKRTREYERILKEKGQEVMGMRPLLKGPIETDVEVRFKIPHSWPDAAKKEALEGLRVPTRKADWDNLAKAGTDSLNEVVYYDDSQITKASVSKVYAIEPGITIKFREIRGVKGGWKPK